MKHLFNLFALSIALLLVCVGCAPKGEIAEPAKDIPSETLSNPDTGANAPADPQLSDPNAPADPSLGN